MKNNNIKLHPNFEEYKEFSNEELRKFKLESLKEENYNETEFFEDLIQYNNNHLYENTLETLKKWLIDGFEQYFINFENNINNIKIKEEKDINIISKEFEEAIEKVKNRFKTKYKEIITSSEVQLLEDEFHCPVEIKELKDLSILYANNDEFIIAKNTFNEAELKFQKIIKERKINTKKKTEITKNKAKELMNKDLDILTSHFKKEINNLKKKTFNEIEYQKKFFNISFQRDLQNSIKNGSLKLIKSEDKKKLAQNLTKFVNLKLKFYYLKLNI